MELKHSSFKHVRVPNQSIILVSYEMTLHVHLVPHVLKQTLLTFKQTLIPQKTVPLTPQHTDKTNNPFFFPSFLTDR